MDKTKLITIQRRHAADSARPFPPLQEPESVRDRRPGVWLDNGGIGDILCALAAATGAGLPFIPPPNRREWAELFEEIQPTSNRTIILKLNDYRFELDQNVAPRWDFWAAQCGGRKLPTLRPLPSAIEDAAIRYAGRVVISPYAMHGQETGPYNRCWPVERWMQVNRLLIEAGFPTCILDSDKERCKGFLTDEPVENEPGAKVRDRTTLLCGKSPALVAAVMRWATAFAGNDSGMAHLAGTLGIPGVAVCSACSDVRIFGCYPTIRELGGRGKDFLAVTPKDVAIAVRERIVSSGNFPITPWAANLLPLDKWREWGWVGVYRALWETVEKLQPRRIVEIGCRAGYSSWTMLNACPDATIQAYDANLDAHGGFLGAMEHAKKILPSDRFTLTLADSHTLTELPAADLVYVDGDHSEAGCYQDLQLALTARPKWILVDDIANCWQEVKPACDRFVREHRLSCEFIPSPTGLYLIHL